MRIRFLPVFVILMSLMNVAQAATPIQIVTSLYKPYLSQNDQIPDAVDLIRPYASASFAKAIQKELTCQKSTQEMCNINGDFIVNAQDWDLAGLQIWQNKNIVTAQFMNDTKNIVRYFFIQKGKAWQIDEIECTRFKKNGKVDFTWNVKETLNRPVE